MDVRGYPEVLALREAVLRPSTAAREAFAAQCLLIVREQLKTNWPRWSLWFNGDFLEAVDSAADQVVAALLVEDPRGSGALPLFRRRLLKALFTLQAGDPSAEPAADSDLDAMVLAADDASLAVALRRLLRLLGEQGMNEEWGTRHREKARLRKRLRDRADRMGLLPGNGDARGTLVQGLFSDLRLRPLTLEALFDLVGAGWTDEGEALERLAVHLVPDDTHGGYCYLNDIVRVLYEVMTGRITHAGSTGAVPGALGIRVTEGGLPESVLVERVRGEVSRLARGFLNQDAGKGKGAGPAPLAALAEVVTEMVCRDFGMGLPAWDRRSQEEMTRAVVPGLTREEYAATSRPRIDYAIRRVRAHLGKGEWLPLMDSHEGMK